MIEKDANVTETPTTRLRFVRRANAAMAAGDAEEAMKVARAGLAAYPESVSLMDALIGALDMAGRPDEALVLAVECAARRHRKLSAARPEVAPRTLGQNGRIFISGYFYSGSGAVLDFLRDYEGVGKWSPAGEMRWIKFPGGLGDLYQRRRENAALGAQDLVDFYLHIVGAKATSAPNGHYTQWRVVNKNSAKLLKSPAATGYLIRCLASFLWLTRRSLSGSLTRAAMVSGFRKAVGEGLDAAAADMGVDVMLVDQAITAWRLKLAKLAPKSTFIVVHRDPRDQFVDASVALSAPGRRSLTAEEFAQRYRQRRRAADRDMAMIQRKFGHNVISLAFEDFVIDHTDTCRDLLARIGFENLIRNHIHYDVEASRANVGKHGVQLSDEDISTLERLLPEYLNPHSTARATGA